MTPDEWNIARDFVVRRAEAYRFWLQSMPDIVREDLKGFCRAEATCFDQDPRVHAALEGRREVWLRFEQHRKIPIDELTALYVGQPKPKDTD